MGDVWSAVHVARGQRVAVKLLTADAARDPDFWMAFRNEVRSVAFLDHPKIVCIYDYGEVTEDECEAGGRQFAPRTPWLAMELVEGDTLLSCCGRVDWEQVSLVCASLLDALAHAHARGVYHRDLKPANVLVGREDPVRTVKLMDFGLAHAAEGTEVDHFNGGTPAYMAPEQFDGRWRNYGPWTDLYGFGCLIYALVSGAPPYGPSRSYEDSREAHKAGTVPPLVAPFPVPAGFESWLRRLLEKDPARRYRRAADALYDLLALQPPTQPAVTRLSRKASDDDTVRLHTLSTLIHAGDLATEEVSFTIGSTMSDPPPLPVDWRGSVRAIREMHAGLNLFGVRKVPLVGREHERDILWSALRQVRETRSIQVVAIHGPAGVGVSRLTEWLGHRAHEVGSAILMRATHSAVPGPRDGLAGMAFRFLRCAGLDTLRLRERVRALVGENREEGEALLELLAPGTAAVRFGSASERFFAVEQLLIRATQERPVVLWLDDVHWGADSLRFVQRLLRRDFDRPVLVMLTATDEVLASRTAERVLWEGLITSPRTRTISVPPLGPESRIQLVQEVVGLEPRLADQVQAATGGNPQFLVRLLEDWVDDGQLLPGPYGFELREGGMIPHDLETLLEHRVERILSKFGHDEEGALELAAVLGREVVAAEWAEGCKRAGLAPSEYLVQDLLDGGLVHRGEGGFGWSFTHRHLPQYLMDRAEASARLEHWHRICAELLARDIDRPGVAARVGVHLVGAELPLQALEPLLDAIRESTNAGEYVHAENLLVRYEAALDAAQLPSDDPRRGYAAFEQYEMLVPQGEMEDSQAVLDDLIADAEVYRWPVLRLMARVSEGRRMRIGGHTEGARTELLRAIEDAEQLGQLEEAASARRELGDLELGLGQLEEGARWVREALQGFELLGNVAAQAKCWQSLGELTKEAGEHEEAAELLSKAESLFETAGNRWGRAPALNSLGDTLPHMGRLEASEDLYRQAAGVFRALGSPAVIYPEYNAALNLLARGEVEAAFPVVKRAIDAFAHLENLAGLANAQLALAVCSAYAGRWLEWDDNLRECLATREHARTVDEDLAWMAEIAGDGAMHMGQEVRARRAYQLALEVWDVLERPARALRMRDKLAVIDGA